MPDLYFLVEFPIFRDFAAEDVDVLGSVCALRPFKAGEAVCRMGGPGDALYIVKSGVLEVAREGRHINLLSEGEFFGEMALVDGSPRSADVLVKEDAVLVELPVQAYARLRREQPACALKVADVMLKQLSFRLRRSNTRALDAEARGSDL